MFRKCVFVVVALVALGSPVWAQTPKLEVAGFIGYTLADGVSGDPIKAGNGQTYDRVDPKDSMNFGFSLGFYVTPQAEVGFLWRRQPTTIQISGTAVTDLADTNIDGYHGYFAYNFGDPEGKVHPYLMGGLGMTHYAGISFPNASGQTSTISGNSQFSTTWGAGVKVNASPNVGVKVGMQWTPTYIKSDAAGWWCDPWWGCYVVGNAQYSNQFEFLGGIVFRF